MANRYFIEREQDGQWAELPTRPLYSMAEAQGFIVALRRAPRGNWPAVILRIVREGRVMEIYQPAPPTPPLPNFQCQDCDATFDEPDEDECPDCGSPDIDVYAPPARRRRAVAMGR